MRPLTFLFISIFMISCNSNKIVLQENPPFEVKEASFQKWFGGIQEAGKGIHFTLTFSEISEDVLVEKIYFRGKSEILKQNAQNRKVYRASFVDKPKEDVILDSNPAMEMDNPKPSIPVKFSFDLKENEAVVQYRKNDKINYFKIDNVTEKEVIAYPSSKPDDN
ncbi:hypothetical protein [uncultured Planktosalinus sp.]|uniref:hypothetical protein n=1 Tax=uncultured Planktosalinus sp. TaxID=1810935 RepID=UPI0030DD3383